MICFLAVYSLRLESRFSTCAIVVPRRTFASSIVYFNSNDLRKQVESTHQVNLQPSHYLFCDRISSREHDRQLLTLVRHTLPPAHINPEPETRASAVSIYVIGWPGQVVLQQIDVRRSRRSDGGHAEISTCSGNRCFPTIDCEL